MKTLAALLVMAVAFTAHAGQIMLETGAPANVRLAAKEIRRYVYLRTGELLPISPEAGTILLRVDGALQPQQYRLRSDGRTLAISGGSDIGVLYGTYSFIEKLGVRFYLHGDVIPDGKIRFRLPVLEETRQPLFELRGIQPFHDFPDGPDWWNQDDYLACVEQLAKMKMNFIGLHCYPHRLDPIPGLGPLPVGPEPLVWLGLPQDINPDGTVKFSYPASWDNTARRSGWPYSPMKTSEFTGGAAQLFPADDYGPDVHQGLMPVPATPQQCNELFNRVGKQMGIVFAKAKKLGVKTCVGTETALTLPPVLAERLKELGKDPGDPRTVAEIYEGIFRRMAIIMPADYYWLWTPEGWNSGNFAHVKGDVLSAYQALKDSGAPMQLATCGWELGPDFNRAAMDEFLPKECPMSCISSGFGHAGLIPSFADVTGRPKWAIPWMESDSNLIGYSPWVGRIRFDAADAKRLGCTGFMGLHWHTKFLMNNIATVARASWDQSYVPAAFGASPYPVPGDGKRTVPIARAPYTRTMPVDDYYADFTHAHFGQEVAQEAGKILASIDSGGGSPEKSTWLRRGDSDPTPTGGSIDPDMSGWGFVWGAQGCLQSHSALRQQAKEKGAIVEKLATLRPKVAGKGNLQRFDWWLATLRASIAMYEGGGVRGDLQGVVARMAAEKDPARKKELANQAVELRIELTKAWDAILRQEILAADTPSELGIIANLERNSRMFNGWLTKFDSAITNTLHEPLPASCAPAMAWDGPAMLKMFTVRSSAHTGEELTLRVIALDKQPVKAVAVKIRLLGIGRWRTLPATRLARAVYEAKLPAAQGDFEYYVTADTAGGQTLVWPPTAPDLSQSVVVHE